MSPTVATIAVGVWLLAGVTIVLTAGAPDLCDETAESLGELPWAVFYGFATFGLLGWCAVYFDGLPRRATDTSRRICVAGGLVALAVALMGYVTWSRHSLCSY